MIQAKTIDMAVYGILALALLSAGVLLLGKIDQNQFVTVLGTLGVLSAALVKMVKDLNCENCEYMKYFKENKK